MVCLTAHKVAQTEQALGAAQGRLGGDTCASGGSARAPFEEGTCAFFLPRWGSALRTSPVGKGKFEVRLEVHQAIADAPNSGTARPAVSTVDHHGVVHGEKKTIQVNLSQSAKRFVEAKGASPCS